ncbi:VOC family protein [Flaviflagellibacter deserti]|uniref:VOC family protein n=1 Tax=Flaviflagellibacter deserti TaxID=2267266 RepID=A0ABV9Z190_9HYPH
MKVLRIDHLVLTVSSIPRSVAFYRDVLGVEEKLFGEDRIALSLGEQKINLHQVNHTFEPKAACPMPGSADLCFVVEDLDAAVSRIARAGITIEEGPVTRSGALGPIQSIYVRDPDLNLIELSVYGTAA